MDFDEAEPPLPQPQRHTGWFLLLAGNYVSRTVMYRKSKHGIEFAELCPSCCCVLTSGDCVFDIHDGEDWFFNAIKDADLVPVV